MLCEVFDTPSIGAARSSSTPPRSNAPPPSPRSEPPTRDLVVADTREQAGQLNAAIRDRLLPKNSR